MSMVIYPRPSQEEIPFRICSTQYEFESTLEQIRYALQAGHIILATPQGLQYTPKTLKDRWRQLWNVESYAQELDKVNAKIIAFLTSNGILFKRLTESYPDVIFRMDFFEKDPETLVLSYFSTLTPENYPSGSIPGGLLQRIPQENRKIFFEKLLKASSDAKENPIYLLVLGVLYDKGFGTQKNSAKAFLSLQKASQLGFLQATCSLGQCYLDGIGTAQDVKEAVRLFTVAAEGGVGLAWIFLGHIHENIDGRTFADFPPNQHEAIRCYQMAHQFQNPGGIGELKRCLASSSFNNPVSEAAALENSKAEEWLKSLQDLRRPLLEEVNPTNHEFII